MNIGIGARVWMSDIEFDDGFELEEDIAELRVTIGGAWGFSGSR